MCGPMLIIYLEMNAMMLTLCIGSLSKSKRRKSNLESKKLSHIKRREVFRKVVFNDTWINKKQLGRLRI